VTDATEIVRLVCAQISPVPGTQPGNQERARPGLHALEQRRARRPKRCHYRAPEDTQPLGSRGSRVHARPGSCTHRRNRPRPDRDPICYDLEFAETPRARAIAGDDLIAVRTNWPLREHPPEERAAKVIFAQAAAPPTESSSPAAPALASSAVRPGSRAA